MLEYSFFPLCAELACLWDTPKRGKANINIALFRNQAAMMTESLYHPYTYTRLANLRHERLATRTTKSVTNPSWIKLILLAKQIKIAK
jgi:hypothetical protein